MPANIIAHRGLSQTHPENTMISFKESYAQGAKAIETDISMLKDGTLVLFHDYALNRCTDRTEGNIDDLVLDDIYKIDAGSWFSSDYSGERIPKLSDFLEEAKTWNIRINLELKGDGDPKLWERMTKATIDEVNDSKIDKELIYYSSFEFEILRYIKKISPKETVSCLFWDDVNNWYDKIKGIGPYSINLWDNNLSKELVLEVKEKNYPIYVYTVNSLDRARDIFEWGVDGIFTDDIRIFNGML